METTSAQDGAPAPHKGNGSEPSVEAPLGAQTENLDEAASGLARTSEAIEETLGEGTAPDPDRAAAAATTKPPQGAAALNVLTSAIGLMMASPQHRHLFLADLEWALLPPLALKQFRLFTKDNKPIAFATWAFVSEEVDARLKAGHMKLKPAEWKSGEICWIVDVVAPFGRSEKLVGALKGTTLKAHDVSCWAQDGKSGQRQMKALKSEDSRA